MVKLTRAQTVALGLAVEARRLWPGPTEGWLVEGTGTWAISGATAGALVRKDLLEERDGRWRATDAAMDRAAEMDASDE